MEEVEEEEPTCMLFLFLRREWPCHAVAEPRRTKRRTP